MKVTDQVEAKILEEKHRARRATIDFRLHVGADALLQKAHLVLGEETLQALRGRSQAVFSAIKVTLDK